MDIKEMENADYDLLENIKAAFYQLWKLKLVVALSALIGLIVCFSVLTIVGNSTVYRTGAGIYSAMYGSYEDSADGARVMNTYASMLGTSQVCERAAETLADPDLPAAKLLEMVRNGEIYLAGASSSSRDFAYRLMLIVASENSDRIADISNAMAQAFADEINDFLGVSTLRVLEPATGYMASQSINEKLYMVIAAAAGFFLSAAIIFLTAFFSPKVYTIGQCEKNPEQILGLIPYSVKK